MPKRKNEVTIRFSAAEYLTYAASVGNQQDSIEMRYEDENIWLTQKMMATLYDVSLPTINEHIKKVFSNSELEEQSTIRKFRIVQTEGFHQISIQIQLIGFVQNDLHMRIERFASADDMANTDQKFIRK